MTTSRDDKMFGMSCGAALAILVFGVTVYIVMSYLSWQAAVYFGYPGWLGLLAFFLFHLLITALRSSRN